MSEKLAEARALKPKTTSGPRTRDAERTRAELLAVATEMFAESGYSGARVDEIAARTSTTKRMIYYYFGGKEQLYLAVLEEAYRVIRNLEAGLDVSGLAPVEAIRKIAELTFDHHVEHDAFIRLVSIENIHRGKFIRQIKSLRELGQPAVAQLEGLLERGRAEKVFRSDIDALDVHLMISSYCVFQVANQYTFGHLFELPFTGPTTRAHLRHMLGDIVVSWLTRGTDATGAVNTTGATDAADADTADAGAVAGVAATGANESPK